MSEAKRLVDLASHLLTQGGNLESTRSGVAIQKSALTDALERQILSSLSTAQPLAHVTAAKTVRHAEEALNKIAGGGSPTNLSDQEVLCLEAIVEVTGRPATRFRGGAVQKPASELGENDKWCTLVVTERSGINKAAASIGCISILSAGGIRVCIGTGWCVAGQLVVTNRHVVADLVQSKDVSPQEWKLAESRQPVIDFEMTDSPRREAKFKITELAYCSPEADYDAAFVRVTPISGTLPAALKLDWKVDSLGTASTEGGSPKFLGSDVYVIGHPFRLLNSDLTASVFVQADGSKRWSPGRIVKLDSDHPSLDHDCSTLGGNSGSCVLSAWNHSVVGLHYGGVNVDETGKGTANLALAISRLGTHKLAQILKTGNADEESR